jgi:hypothetical protein
MTLEPNVHRCHCFREAQLLICQMLTPLCDLPDVTSSSNVAPIEARPDLVVSWDQEEER